MTNSIEAQILQITTLQRERDTGRLDCLGRFDETAIDWDIALPSADLIIDTEDRFFKREKFVHNLKGTFKVFITHDVDWITGWEPVSIIKACLETTHIRSGQWLSVSRVLKPNLFENNIRRLLEYEINHHIGSFFFMLSGPHGFGRYSSRYDCEYKKARRLMNLMLDAGMTVGLHGSFYAREYNSYAHERQRLEDAIGVPVSCHRNHYLRFDSLLMSSQLEHAGIGFDFSIGYQSRLGFRSGTAIPYQLIDILNDRSSNVIEIPLLMMDTAVGVKNIEETISSLRSALTFVKELGGSVSLLFHPESFLIDDRYWELFEKSIALCVEMGADLKGTLPKSGKD